MFFSLRLRKDDVDCFEESETMREGTSVDGTAENIERSGFFSVSERMM